MCFLQEMVLAISSLSRGTLSDKLRWYVFGVLVPCPSVLLLFLLLLLHRRCAYIVNASSKNLEEKENNGLFLVCRDTTRLTARLNGGRTSRLSVSFYSPIPSFLFCWLYFPLALSGLFSFLLYCSPFLKK